MSAKRTIQYTEYAFWQTIYIFLMIGVSFFVLVYFKAEADLRILVIIGFGTWIALILFILILGLANKYGWVRNPGSVWWLPSTLSLKSIPFFVTPPFFFGVISNLDKLGFVQ